VDYIQSALRALNEGDLDSVQKFLLLEQDYQRRNPSVVTFSLEDISDDDIDVAGLTDEDAKFIADEIWNDTIAEDYSLSLRYVMETHFPERIKG
jgi:hypothetical protein